MMRRIVVSLDNLSILKSVSNKSARTLHRPEKADEPCVSMVCEILPERNRNDMQQCFFYVGNNVLPGVVLFLTGRQGLGNAAYIITWRWYTSSGAA